jgi:hypothetical protein
MAIFFKKTFKFDWDIWLVKKIKRIFGGKKNELD